MGSYIMKVLVYMVNHFCGQFLLDKNADHISVQHSNLFLSPD